MQLPHAQSPNLLALTCLIVGAGMFLISAAPVGTAFVIAGLSAYVCQWLLAGQRDHHHPTRFVHHRLREG